jgi:hypothetical protein
MFLKKLTMSKYGDLPFSLGMFKEIECTEMMYYLYLPIKMAGSMIFKVETRLDPFEKLIGAANCDFVGLRGLDALKHSYVYVSAKRLFQSPGHSFNRPGWHSDGFMTDDVNYIWCDRDPTLFNKSQYALTEHHEYSLSEMDIQSLKENDVHYKPKEFLRLTQFNIHRVADVTEASVRTFFKLSFSKEKYNLKGNSINPHFEYDWRFEERHQERNHTVKMM